jgi:hypothetical protein
MHAAEISIQQNQRRAQRKGKGREREEENENEKKVFSSNEATPRRQFRCHDAGITISVWSTAVVVVQRFTRRGNEGVEEGRREGGNEGEAGTTWTKRRPPSNG